MAGKDVNVAPFSWRVFFTALASFSLVVLLLGLLVGLVVGMRPLEERVERIAGVRAGTIDIRWPVISSEETGETLTWVPEKERVMLLAIAEEALARDAGRFTGAPIERVGQAMATSGWFQKTPTVRREVGGRVVVDGAWRVPAAVVRRDGVDQLVSWEGFPMPLTAAIDSTLFPVIAGPALPAPMNTDRAPDYATAWPGEDVAASLELLQVLLRQPFAGQIKGVDAGTYAAERTLVILTTHGTRVVWGGRVSKPALGEVTSAQKIAHLQTLFDRHKRIDAGYPVIYVNNTKLQFDVSATAQAIAPDLLTDGAPAETDAAVAQADETKPRAR